MAWPGWDSYRPPSLSETETTREKRSQPSKMRNKRTRRDGRWFDSGSEAERYSELQLRAKAGEIAKLECQPRFDLHTLTPAGEWVKVARCTPDFRYVDVATGATVIEDVKSPVSRTEAYQHRKRHLEAEYGLTLIEL